MTEYIGSLIFCGLVAVVINVGIAVANVYQDKEQKRHREAMAAWAKAHGLSYIPASARVARMFDGEPFSAGDYINAVDVISGPGPHGHRFWSYIYEYSSGGKANEIMHCWIVVLQMPRRLPWLHVNYETPGSRFLHAVGEQDIQFESGDFNKTYDVRAASPQYAFAVLHPQVIDWLLGPGRAIIPIRLTGQAMIWWQEGEPVYSRLASQVKGMAAFIDHIPSFVWHDYGRDGPTQPALRG